MIKITKKLVKVGRSSGFIIDKIWMERYNLKNGDIVEITITKIDIQRISIKCPKCEEILVVDKDSECTDCTKCGLEIKDTDFDIQYV